VSATLRGCERSDLITIEFLIFLMPSEILFWKTIFITFIAGFGFFKKIL
jgi:hypothetical protein